MYIEVTIQLRAGRSMQSLSFSNYIVVQTIINTEDSIIITPASNHTNQNQYCEFLNRTRLI